VLGRVPEKAFSQKKKQCGVMKGILNIRQDRSGRGYYSHKAFEGGFSDMGLGKGPFPRLCPSEKIPRKGKKG